MSKYFTFKVKAEGTVMLGIYAENEEDARNKINDGSWTKEFGEDISYDTEGGELINIE
ncbi:MAG: hypothetical protein K0Q53_117 [Massilibacillus sp.]|jgi:hypothetical protein|nr:hypothetical protein [Massilibacillus sp.]